MAYEPWVKRRVIELWQTGQYTVKGIRIVLGHGSRLPEEPPVERTIRRWIAKGEDNTGAGSTVLETDVAQDSDQQTDVESLELLLNLRNSQRQLDQRKHWEDLCEVAHDLRRSLVLPDVVGDSYVRLWGSSLPKPWEWLDIVVRFDIFDDFPYNMRYLNSHLEEHSFEANYKRAQDVQKAYFQAQKNGEPTEQLEHDLWNAIVRLCKDLEPELVRNVVLAGHCEACPLP